MTQHTATGRQQVVTKVWIEEGCIVCNVCESNCPQVFQVDETCTVRPEGETPEKLVELSEEIRLAAEECPVEVIRYQEGPPSAGDAAGGDQSVGDGSGGGGDRSGGNG